MQSYGKRAQPWVIERVQRGRPASIFFYSSPASPAGLSRTPFLEGLLAFPEVPMLAVQDFFLYLDGHLGEKNFREAGRGREAVCHQDPGPGQYTSHNCPQVSCWSPFCKVKFSRIGKGGADCRVGANQRPRSGPRGATPGLSVSRSPVNCTRCRATSPLLRPVSTTPLLVTWREQGLWHREMGTARCKLCLTANPV